VLVAIYFLLHFVTLCYQKTYANEKKERIYLTIFSHVLYLTYRERKNITSCIF
jgi:hypothetical protein